MKFVHMECYDGISKACSKSGIEFIQDDWKANEKCVDDSFENTGRKGNNTILYDNS